MADFSSNVVGQVLGSAPEIRPLVPPQFAPWPRLLRADTAPWPQEQAVSQERDADAALFPSPLIDAEHPAFAAPLPTLRQMAGLKTAPGSPVQAGPTRLARDTTETADVEQDGIQQDMIQPIRPAVEATSPGAQQATSPTVPISPDTFTAALPIPPVPAQADQDSDDSANSSPAYAEVSSDRPFQEIATMESDQGLLPRLSSAPVPSLHSAPQPAAGQERAKYSARPYDPPARMGRLQRHTQVEPVEEQPELIEFQPESDEVRPAPVSPPSEHIKGQPNRVEQPPVPVFRQPENVEGRRAEIPAQSPAPHTTQPFRLVLAQGMEPVTPLVPQSVPATGLSLPVPIPAGEHTPEMASALTSGSIEPAPPDSPAVPGKNEPVIMPAPESVSGKMWPMTRNEDRKSFRQPLERPNTGDSKAVLTVRVSIGRVVVRASPAAERPASQRVELPRPPVSLEEYLQGRQGGER